MARPLPKLPHPSVPVVDGNRLVTPEWRDFFSALERRTAVTGTAVFAAGTTVNVTFATPEIDTNYVVLTERPSSTAFSIGSKTTTGFVITASASNSDTVGWAILRK